MVATALAHATIAMKLATCHVSVQHRKRLANVSIAMKKDTCPANVHPRDNKMVETVVEIALVLATIAMKQVTFHANAPPRRPQNVSSAEKKVTCHVNAQIALLTKRFASVAGNQATVSVIAPQMPRKARHA